MCYINLLLLLLKNNDREALNFKLIMKLFHGYFIEWIEINLFMFVMYLCVLLANYIYIYIMLQYISFFIVYIECSAIIFI